MNAMNHANDIEDLLTFDWQPHRHRFESPNVCQPKTLVAYHL
jgi:hypothetical protein